MPQQLVLLHLLLFLLFVLFDSFVEEELAAPLVLKVRAHINAVQHALAF